MRTLVEKSPAGLTVLVPDTLARLAGLREGVPADVEWSGGSLTIRSERPSTLADLLSRVTPENIHAEWASGAPSGAELL